MVRRRVDSRTGGIREVPFAKMYKYKCILSVHLGEKVDCLRAQQLSQIIQLLPASTSPCATLMPPKLLPCITEGQFKLRIPAANTNWIRADGTRLISNHSKLSIIEDIGNVLPSDRMVDRARLGVFCDHNCSPDELSFRSVVQIPSTTTTYNGKPFPTSLPISHLYHHPCFLSPLYTFHPLATLGARQLSLRDFKPQHPTFVGEMYREE